MKDDAITVAFLADRRELIPVIAGWLEEEWPQWYGAGKEHDPMFDTEDAASKDRLPVGVVAFLDEEPVGFARLKVDSIPTLRHLTPWATAGLVRKEYRRKGVGSRLLVALEDAAKNMGYDRIFCGTSQAQDLLDHSGWPLREYAWWDDEKMSIYEKAL